MSKETDIFEHAAINVYVNISRCIWHVVTTTKKNTGRCVTDALELTILQICLSL